MKTIFAALALAIAAPAAAQTAPATNPHAGHSQHQQQGTAGQHGDKSHDHAKMMDECKKAAAAGKCKEHCEAMMKQHKAPAPAAAAETGSHEGHAH